jgi:hypothetical protein
VPPQAAQIEKNKEFCGAPRAPAGLCPCTP